MYPFNKFNGFTHITIKKCINGLEKSSMDGKGQYYDLQCCLLFWFNHVS